MRNEATDAERLLWNRLRRSQLETLKFSRQMPIGPYIVDFLCRSHRLAVELDGSQHVDAMDYDAARTRYLEDLGLRVIRFWNNDLTSNMEGVLEMIADAARAPTPQPPPASGRGGATP